MNSTQLLAGAGLALLVSYTARRARALSASGAWAAFVVGWITFGLGGAVPAVLLLLFFVSSSLLSRVGSAAKSAAATSFEKGGERDAGQVFSNGSIAAAAAAFFGLTGDSRWLAVLAGALAAVNADTWATELGVLARGWPRRLLGGRVVPPGTSGAVTGEGLLAALGGAALIGLPAGLAGGTVLGAAATAGGFFGALADSLLGGTFQAMFWCPTCRRETEKHPVHSCGTATSHVRGVLWLRNDGVNIAASVVGAALTAFLAGG